MPRIVRGLVLLLVVLAASPLTTPYATCDLFDLFGESEPGSQAAVKVPSPQEAPVLAARALPAIVVRDPRPAEAGSRPFLPAYRSQVSRPLRL